jgi:hypothetical protein
MSVSWSTTTLFRDRNEPRGRGPTKNTSSANVLCSSLTLSLCPELRTHTARKFYLRPEGDDEDESIVSGDSMYSDSRPTRSFSVPTWPDSGLYVDLICP